MSDALVWAALEKRALQVEKEVGYQGGRESAISRRESVCVCLSVNDGSRWFKPSPLSRRIHTQDSSDVGPCVSDGRHRAP